MANLANPGQGQKPPCPFPLTRLTPDGPCVRPGFVTPFGGPASGLFPSSSRGSPASGPAPASCVPVTVFADCFQRCTGVISDASPGPICGWTFSEPFGPATGSISFVPGSMIFNTTDPADLPGDTKSLPVSLMTINGISGQFLFTEYPTPPNANTAYEIFINTFGSTQGFGVALFGDGSVVIQSGDNTLASNFLGTWTPDNGSHAVFFAVDESGVPTLFIDQVPIPLTFAGTTPFPITSFLNANSVTFFSQSGSATPASSPVTGAFVTQGTPDPAAVFCCPP